MDANPWEEMADELQSLAKQWQKRFDDLAEKAGRTFVSTVSGRTDLGLKKILTEGGFGPSEWKLSAAQKDVLGALVHENVSLIKSIPQQYLGKVEQDVMRSVAAGRGLKQLISDLQTHYGVTRDRAKLIATHQNRMATGLLTRVRYGEAGIEKAVWMHSGVGLHPRPNHVRAGRDQVVFDVAKGWWDKDAYGPGKGAWIFPGFLQNCGCLMRPVIPAFVAEEVE